MARRKTFLSVLNSIAKESARQQRVTEQEGQRRQREVEKQYKQHERELIQKQKEAERLAREAERTEQRKSKEAEKAAKQAAKEAHEEYLFALALNVADRNAQLTEQLSELRLILEHTLAVNDTISFESLYESVTYPDFCPLAELTTPLPPPNRERYLAHIEKPKGIRAVIGPGRSNYQKQLLDAESQFNRDFQAYEHAENERKTNLLVQQKEYEGQRDSALAEIVKRNSEIAELAKAYQSGEPQAIITYNVMVLERSQYPEGFPQEFRLAYIPESKELVIEYELPTTEIIPTVQEYRLAKNKETLEEVGRKSAEIKELYQEVIAAISIRTIHEVFEADQVNHLDLVTFNGFVASVDPATGRDIRPHLISVRSTKERFSELNLARVDKRACLRNLGAQVSPRPAEMQAVKPIVEFDMVDKRFVEESDVLSNLESRPNLMELNPFEFENLVSNLFGLMGLDAKLTRSSRDGGVDCVAFDTRPILGGKVVIQAKRYSNTVGVSAVRDLYGTMMNEGANKGILVATSSYGTDAYEFAKDKPIELIDGGGLLYLLEQNGIKARIININPG